MSRGRRLDPAWITVDTSKHASPTIHDTAFSVSARIPRLTRAFAYRIAKKKKERIPFSLPFEPILLSTRLETLVPEDFEMFVSIANEEADEDGGNF